MAELRHLKAGDPITEGWLARLVDAVQRAFKITAAPPISVTQDENGVRFYLSSETRIRLAKYTGSAQSSGERDAKFQTWDTAAEKFDDEYAGEVKVFDAAAAGEGAGLTTVYFDRTVGRWMPLLAEGFVGKARAKQDWSAGGTFKAWRLTWTGTTFQQGDEIEIRDPLNQAGKSGQFLFYTFSDGVYWHLNSPCPT